MKSATTILTCLLVFSATAQTVSMVKDINPGSGSSEIKDAVALNGKLYFSALEPQSGRELWISGGIPSNTVLKDIQVGSQSSEPAGFQLLDGTVYFKAKVPPSSQNKERMMRIQGGSSTPEVFAPELVTRRDSAYSNDISKAVNVAIGSLHTTTRTIYFSSTYGITGQELWKWYQAEWGNLAGTSSGWSWAPPILVKDINPTGDSDPRNFTTLNGKTYFTADNGVNGRELWVTDGTPTGTSLLKDINPGAPSSGITGFVVMGSKLYFTATTASHGAELWYTDGTTAGTVLVKDINTKKASTLVSVTGPTLGSKPTGLMVWKNKLYFSADNGTNGEELWCSDGTAAGTVMLKDINATGSSSPKNFSGYIRQGQDPVTKQIVNQQFLTFTANDGTTGEELWRSDGTAAGTVLLKDVKAGTRGSSASELRGLNTSTIAGATVITHYYYSAIGGNNGRELWEFHPLSNTHKKISPPVAPNTNPLGQAHNWPWVQMGNALYFYANYDSNGGELWKVSRP